MGVHLARCAYLEAEGSPGARDHLSVMEAVTAQAKVYSPVRPTSLNGLHTVAFLIHLGRTVGDRDRNW